MTSGLDSAQRIRCRDRVVQAALLAYNHKGAIHYTQDARRWQGIREHCNARLGEYPQFCDCSSFVTWCEWNGLHLGFGRPDVVNGLDWRYGATSSMLQHGRPVASLASVLRGDAVIYGGGGGRHAAVVVAVKNGTPMVVSHGSEAGPFYVPWNYRSDVNCFRRYI